MHHIAAELDKGWTLSNNPAARKDGAHSSYPDTHCVINWVQDFRNPGCIMNLGVELWHTTVFTWSTGVH